jgi:zinc finger SWIM domain-containing protein 3
VVENPKLEAQLWLKFLSHKFHNMAYKAASSTECCLFLDNALDCLGTQQLEDKLNISSTEINEISCKDQENVESNVKQKDDLLSVVQLKKKRGPV